MAQRHRTEETIRMNQENMHKKIVTKPDAHIKSGLTRRPALGEVKLSEANKLANTNNQLSNGIAKKNVLMGPPSNKTVDTVTKTEKTIKAVEKTQTSNNIKPLLKKQEAALKNINLKDVKTTEFIKSYSSKQISIIDPDESSKNEPQMVTEYLGDIFSYLRELECKYPIKKHFLEGHQSTSKMRAILMNWLVDVHMNFKLYLETLHLCVAIVDRYLQENKSVGRDTLQLVGISAMFIASKYEEMYIPDLQDFVFICDNAFSGRQILLMEIEILRKLDFNLGRPLSLHFLRRFNKIAQARSDQHTLGKYLLELALVEYEMSHIRPSIIAAAACCLSIGILNEIMDLSKVWTPTLVHYTTYEYSQFRNVIVDLAQLIVKSKNTKHKAVQSKYASSSYSKISLNPKLNGPLVRKLTLTTLVKK